MLLFLLVFSFGQLCFFFITWGKLFWRWMKIFFFLIDWFENNSVDVLSFQRLAYFLNKSLFIPFAFKVVKTVNVEDKSQKLVLNNLFRSPDFRRFKQRFCFWCMGFWWFIKNNFPFSFKIFIRSHIFLFFFSEIKWQSYPEKIWKHNGRKEATFFSVVKLQVSWDIIFIFTCLLTMISNKFISSFELFLNNEYFYLTER